MRVPVDQAGSRLTSSSSSASRPVSRALAAGQAEGDVLGDRQVREQRALLRQVAQTALSPVGTCRDGPLTSWPSMLDGAGVGPQEPGDQPQQRGLAAAGRAEDRGDADRPATSSVHSPQHGAAAERTSATAARPSTRAHRPRTRRDCCSSR